MQIFNNSRVPKQLHQTDSASIIIVWVGRQIPGPSLSHRLPSNSTSVSYYLNLQWLIIYLRDSVLFYIYNSIFSHIKFYCLFLNVLQFVAWKFSELKPLSSITGKPSILFLGSKMVWSGVWCMIYVLFYLQDYSLSPWERFLIWGLVFWELNLPTQLSGSLAVN